MKKLASATGGKIVTNVDDSDDNGRVKVKIPSLKNDEETTWARMVAPGAGSKRGIQWLPEVNDEVLVAFEHGDIDRPLILGGLWSDKNGLPMPNSECIGGGIVNQRVIRSRSGHVIILDDSDGAELIKVCDKTGNNEIVVDSASNSMTVKADKDITIEAKGKINIKSSNGDLSLEGKNLKIATMQNFTVEATGSCNIKSTQNCTVEGTAGLTMKNATGAQIAMSGPSVNVNNGALEVT